MAASKKMVSVNEFEKAIDAERVDMTEIEWGGVLVEVKNRLSLDEMLSFVQSVVRSCFNEEDGSYVPESKQFAIRWNLVALYTNVRLPKDVKKKYDLLYGTGFVGAIRTIVDDEQLQDIEDAIDSRIDDILDSRYNEIQHQVDDLSRMITTLQESVGSSFDGIDSEQIKNVLLALTNGMIDEGKIAKAFIEASEKNE